MSDYELDLDEIQSILNKELGDGVAEVEVVDELPTDTVAVSTTEWSEHPDLEGVETRITDAGKLFGDVGLLGQPVKQYRGLEALSTITVPTPIDPYEINTEMIRALCIASVTGLKPLFVGDTGSGKTSGIEQFAALTGRPFHRQEFDEFTDDQKLFGSLEMRAGGETYFNKSDLTKSISIPAIVCCDEIFAATSGTQMALNPLTDRRQIRVTSHDESVSETINAHPEWMVTFTDNTAGNGDGLDIYNTRSTSDQAMNNRIDMFVHVPYPSESAERRLITALAPDLDIHEVRRLAKFSQECHKAFESRDITCGFSVRNLRAILGMISQHLTVKEAIGLNFINRVAKSEQSDVNTLVRSIWGE